MKLVFTARVEHKFDESEKKEYLEMSVEKRNEIIQAKIVGLKNELIGFGAEEDEIKELSVFVDEGV